jgi:protease I
MAIQDLKVIQLVEDGYHDMELWYPVNRLREEGATVHLVGAEANHRYVGKYGVPATADHGYDDMNPEYYDAILIPGGWAPDKLRQSPQVLSMVYKMHQHQKPIGCICHGAWVLISAKILKGMQLTSVTAIRDDVENAGAVWLPDPVVRDRHIISAQKPNDLPAYMKSFIGLLSEISKG